jgi:transcriptional regulator GlxA family with amidase domain
MSARLESVAQRGQGRSRLSSLEAMETARVRAANDVLLDQADVFVERAIGAMRADPARRWTVASLARVACLSRAAFARRFQRATGTSPLRWLTEHRLRLAQARLRESKVALAAIAVSIGYASEFAFSKAFKRHFGVAPNVFRRSAFGAPSFRAAA